MPATRVFAVTGFTLPKAGYRGMAPSYKQPLRPQG